MNWRQIMGAIAGIGILAVAALVVWMMIKMTDGTD